MNFVSLTSPRNGHFTLHEIFPVFILVGVWVDPWDAVGPGVLCQRKIPKTPSGIESVSFRLVAQCYRLPRKQGKSFWNYKEKIE